MNKHASESSLRNHVEAPLPEEDPRNDGANRSHRMLLRSAALRVPLGSHDDETPSRTDLPRNSSTHSRSSFETSNIMSASDQDPMTIRKTATTDTEYSANPSDGNESPIVKIDHSITVSKNGQGAARKLTKPVIALIGTILLLTTGSAAYFFSEWLTIPGLKTQVDRLEDQVLLLKSEVDRLEAQVDRLGGEVDRLHNEVNRLSNETDRLSGINDQLEINIDNYAAENHKLNTSVHILMRLNGQLNTTTLDLMVQVEDLKMLNESLVEQNRDLNSSIAVLSEEVKELDGVNERLTKTTKTLWVSIDKLTNETIELTMRNHELNLTVTDLKTEVSNMTGEIDRLNRITADLATLVTFLNDTASDMDESLEGVTAYLAEQISLNRALVMGSLKNLYLQRTSNWDCDFREYFLTESFTSNRNASIGTGSFEFVMDYIDERVLSDLCLEKSDFESFLGEYIDSAQLSDASFNQMQQAVGEYTDLALGFYFTANNTTNSITPTIWAEAKYECKSLPPDVSFRFATSA